MATKTPKQTIRQYLITQGVDWERSWSSIVVIDNVETELDLSDAEFRMTIRTGERITSPEVTTVEMVPNEHGSYFEVFEDPTTPGKWWVRLVLHNEDTQRFPPRTLYATIERRWASSGQEDNFLGQLQFIVAPSTTHDAEDDV